MGMHPTPLPPAALAVLVVALTALVASLVTVAAGPPRRRVRFRRHRDGRTIVYTTRGGFWR